MRFEGKTVLRVARCLIYIACIGLGLSARALCATPGEDTSVAQVSVAQASVVKPSASQTALQHSYYKQIVDDSTGKVCKSYKERLIAYDSLIQWSLAAGDTLAYYRYRQGKGRTLKHQGNIQLAYKEYKDLLYSMSTLPALSEGERQIQRKTMLELPTLLSALERKAECLKYLSDIIKKYPVLDTVEGVNFYTDLASAYIDIDLAKSMDYIAQAWELADYTEDHVKCRVYNVLSGQMLYRGYVDSALFYLDQARQHNTGLYAELNQSLIYLNYAQICRMTGEAELAGNYFQRILEAVPSSSYSWIRGKALLGLAGLHIDQGHYNKALAYLEEGLAYANQIQDKSLEYRSYLGMGIIFKKQGRPVESLEAYLRAYAIKDSLQQADTKDQISWLEQDHDQYRHEMTRMMELAQADNRQLSDSRRTLIIVLSAAAVLLIFLIVIIFLLLQSLRYRRAYERKNEEAHQREEHVLREKARQVREVDFLRTIAAGLRELRHLSDLKARNRIVADLEAAIRTYETAEPSKEIMARFTLSHPAFIEKLSHDYPQLSEKEHYLCVLIVSGMSAKEIAIANHFALRSVETMMYRLRKKMGLPTEVKTQDFLKKILETADSAL